MFQNGPAKSRSRLLSVHFWGLTLTWVLVVTALAMLDLYQVRQTSREMAIKEARAHFNKDQAFRLWASSHGGIYVPVTERTSPSPFLEHVPERDIQTPGGKSLTLMNPALMIRQVMDEYAGLHGILGHITSLKPLRPETAPDEWESESLWKFEKGVKEVAEFADIDGEPYVRYMRPIFAREDCLHCHAGQGYKVGDVKGGISISVPMAPYLASTQKTVTVHAVSFVVLLFLGLSAVGFMRHKLMREMRDRDQTEIDLRLARDALSERTAELTKSNVLLNQSNSALNEFASIASHDLQEPLRKIEAFGNLLRSRHADRLSDEGLDCIQRMQMAAGRMHELIESLLDYSRLSTKAKAFSPVDLAELMREVLDDLEVRLLQTGGIVHVGDLPVIEADRCQMRQLFQNLIANGLKYHKDGVDPILKISCIPHGKRFQQLRVEDNGIGFDEKYLDRIFAPFQRLHGQGRYKGTGIGLAICRKIVECHGGSITARSTPGVGSVFIVTLPVGQPQAVEADLPAS